MNRVRLFCGYDSREAIGYHVFLHSVLSLASAPVSVTALASQGLPTGSNAFTYSRFLVPWLCDYKGHAIFADGSDMLCLRDVAELDALFDPQYAVQVVKHPYYLPRNPRKYVGTEMECENRGYLRKNWASVMLFNCEHAHWQRFNPQSLPALAGLALLQFEGLRTSDTSWHGPCEVGALPNCWNRIVDEGQPLEDAAVMHWTEGIPYFPFYRGAPGAELWFRAKHEMELAVFTGVRNEEDHRPY